MSIFPQSHRPEVDTSLSPNNCNASLPREGCARAAAYYMIRHFRHKRLLRFYGVSDGSANFVCCLARCSFYRRLRRSHVDSDMS
jgi:hypothetical protein